MSQNQQSNEQERVLKGSPSIGRFNKGLLGWFFGLFAIVGILAMILTGLGLAGEINTEGPAWVGLMLGGIFTVIGLVPLLYFFCWVDEVTLRPAERTYVGRRGLWPWVKSFSGTFEDLDSLGLQGSSWAPSWVIYLAWKNGKQYPLGEWSDPLEARRRCEELSTQWGLRRVELGAREPKAPLVYFKILQLMIPRLPPLVRQLGEPTECESAWNQLLNLGPGAVPYFLEALSSPREQVAGEESSPVVWDGVLACGLAAEGLGRLQAREAVEPLVGILDDPHPMLRAKVLGALGDIGEARVVSALLPWLGDEEPVGEGRKVSDYAAEALRQLGAGELVESYQQAQQGDPAALEKLKEKHRSLVVEGLLGALDHPAAVAVNAVRMLGALGVVEALPPLRRKASQWTGSVLGQGPLRKACQEAIAAIEKKAGGTLPRPAGEPELSPETLPRPAGEE